MSAQTRIYRLIQLLDAHPDITLDELAAALACPASIIRGDLSALSALRKD